MQRKRVHSWRSGRTPGLWQGFMTFAYRGRQCKVVVDQADGDRAIADGRGHAFDRAMPDVASGEHARGSGLEQVGSPLQGPVLSGVGSGEDESPLVASYSFG